VFVRGSEKVSETRVGMAGGGRGVEGVEGGGDDGVERIEGGGVGGVLEAASCEEGGCGSMSSSLKISPESKGSVLRGFSSSEEEES
jgi:hypothetical protein